MMDLYSALLRYLQRINWLLVYCGTSKVWRNTLSCQIILQGLRVQIFPGREVDENFKKLRETGLLQCSRIMIGMLVEHDRELLIQTKAQIQALDLKLATFDQTTQVIPFQKKLKEVIERYEKYIISGKKLKFQRDKSDYDKDMAYKWKHAGNKRGHGHEIICSRVIPHRGIF